MYGFEKACQFFWVNICFLMRHGGTCHSAPNIELLRKNRKKSIYFFLHKHPRPNVSVCEVQIRPKPHLVNAIF